MGRAMTANGSNSDLGAYPSWVRSSPNNRHGATAAAFPFGAITGSRATLRCVMPMDYQLMDKRKLDPKRRAAVITIFCPYQPVVRLYNGARDGQSHAHAFRLAG
jgi:hypothetical protein